jgi:prepilin-type N-terminal cleavage/methylation domain-containing protein
VVRNAFTLIELIFAIVVIAISVVSLPMMTQVTSNGIEKNLVQEAIFIAATKLNEAVTAKWDENSTEVNGTNFYTRVIDMDGNGDGVKDCENNASSPRYREMPGHINQPLHRRCLDSSITNPSYANVSGDALESMIITDQNVTLATTDASGGYKDDYTATVTVDSNASFNGNNVNIKKIESTIKNSKENPIVVLRTYSANIGEVDYYKRSY